MDRRSWGASDGISALAIVLAMAGCGRPSRIVKMVEKAGAGNLRTASLGSIVEWLEKHPAVALKADNLCAPVRKKARAVWPETTEGRVCHAAAQVAGFIVWQRELEATSDHRTFQGGSK